MHILFHWLPIQHLLIPVRAAEQSPVSTTQIQEPLDVDSLSLRKQFRGHGVTFSSLSDGCVMTLALKNGSVVKLMLPSGLITSYKAMMWHQGSMELLHTSVSIGKDGEAIIYGAYFLTKIFHPNIANNGEICVNALKKDWNPTLGLRHVLMVIRCLLIEPFPESALNEQAGKMLLENYEEYARHARIYTGIHALKSKAKFKTGAISESKTALNVEQQPNTLNNSTDEKNAVGTTTVQPTSQSVPLASGGAGKGGGLGHDPVDVTSAEVGASTTTTMQKKEGVVAKVGVIDKKKIDARKKSLKRL